MTLRLIDVRHTATSDLPSDVANNNCVQDALSRLRQELRRVDATGIYSETQPAPEYLLKARSNLFAWIKEARA
jgi:hypothetical protein